MKRMLKVFLLLFFIGVIFKISPCSADNKKLLKIAEPIAVQLNKAMETKDYDMYMKPWSQKTKKMLKKEDFLKKCDWTLKNLGKLKSKTFYNIVNYKGYKIVQWKVKYSKIPQDLYLRLVLKKIKGKYYVEGHWILKEPLKV